MSLFTADTPVLKAEGLETKFDFKIFSNSLSIVVGDYVQAMFVQQLHYFNQQGYGVVIDGLRWIYKPMREWKSDCFPIISPWKLNQAILALLQRGWIYREHLFDKHHGHNFFAENRTYYYALNYKKIEEDIAKYISNQDEENNESSRFEVILKTGSKPTKSRFLSNFKNKSENTIKIDNQRKQKKEKNPSPTPPIDSPKKSKPRPKLKIRTSAQAKSQIPINTNSGGGNSSSTFSNSKPINQEKGTQPKVDLSKVIARPEKPNVSYKAVGVEVSNGDVDYKVNKQNECTIKQAVQEVVQNLDVQVEVLSEPVQQVEVIPEPVQPPVVEESKPIAVESPPEPEPKTERQKTPKGTKPRKRVHENALWKTMEERNNFERALTHRVVNGVGKARNPMALVRYVMNQITQGISHPYWEEWISGVVIGTCETQEWEASPGYTYPKFVEYLVEKLKYDGESRSQAQFRLGKILDDVSKARVHWREFKRILEGLRQDADKAAANGQQVALPTWFIDRAEISLERAGESAQTLTKLAPEQTDWIYRGLPESEKLLTAAANSLQPGIPEIPPGQKQLESKPLEITVIADPWADGDNNEEDEDFCFNGFIHMGYLEQQAKKVAANPGNMDFVLVDFQSAVAQATQKQRYLIRERIEPICPELFNFL